MNFRLMKLFVISQQYLAIIVKLLCTNYIALYYIIRYLDIFSDIYDER
jgi:hypothetical protein